MPSTSRLAARRFDSTAGAPAGSLERLPSLDEDAMRRAHAGANHDGSGGGQPQGAGAGDDQDGDAKQQGKEEGGVALQGGATGGSQRAVMGRWSREGEEPAGASGDT